MEENKDTDTTQTTEQVTRMAELLRQFGCQPEVKSDGSIDIEYRGENFEMQFSGPHVRIWNTSWGTLSADNPNLTKLYEAVNSVNYNHGATVVMSKPDHNNCIILHSRRDIIMHPDLPDKVGYVESILDSFFETKENLRNLFLKLIGQQSTPPSD